MEKFLQWIKVKATLHFLDFHPPFVSEGQIWWVSLGENIGTEINGKGNLFSRPVIIFKKLSNKFYAVIPASTKIHSGNWYFPYTFKDLKVVACMHQVRSIDYRRLSTCLGTLNENEFLELKKAMLQLYYPDIEKIFPAISGGAAGTPETESFS